MIFGNKGQIRTNFQKLLRQEQKWYPQQQKLLKLLLKPQNILGYIREAVSLKKIFEIVRENSLKRSKLINF